MELIGLMLLMILTALSLVGVILHTALSRIATTLDQIAKELKKS